MRETPEVNIQEPPVSELKKQRSCLKRSCTSGCGCIVLFFVGILVLLNLLTGSGFKEVKDVPDTFPEGIELYEMERIDSISVSDKPVRGGVANAIAIVPKAFLASTYLMLGDSSPGMIGSYYDTVTFEAESNWHRFWRLMKEPLTPESEQIELVWRDLPAEPRFIQEFYTTTFESNAYDITVTANTAARRQIMFEHNEYIGSVLIRDNTPDIKGTDFVQFTISLPLDS